MIYAENSTVSLKMRENTRNNKIDLITKIVAIISFVYFNKSRVKWIMIQRTTEVITIVIKNILLKIVLSLSKKIFELTLWKAFDRILIKARKKHFLRDSSSKFRMFRKIKWVCNDCRCDCESQTKISKYIRWMTCLDKE